MKIDALNLNTEHFTVEHLQNTPANRRLIERAFPHQTMLWGLKRT